MCIILFHSIPGRQLLFLSPFIFYLFVFLLRSSLMLNQWSSLRLVAYEPQNQVQNTGFSHTNTSFYLSLLGSFVKS